MSKNVSVSALSHTLSIFQVFCNFISWVVRSTAPNELVDLVIEVRGCLVDWWSARNRIPHVSSSFVNALTKDLKLCGTRSSMITSKVPLILQVLVFIPHLAECFEILAMFGSPGNQLLA